MPYCPSCGEAVDGSDPFCRSCGDSLGENPAPSADPPNPQGVTQNRSTIAPGVRSVLAPHVAEFDDAAEETDDPAEADVYAVLAALGRGQKPPAEPSARVLERARGGS